MFLYLTKILHITFYNLVWGLDIICYRFCLTFNQKFYNLTYSNLEIILLLKLKLFIIININNYINGYKFKDIT